MGREGDVASEFDPHDIRERPRASARIHETRGVEHSAPEDCDRPVFEYERFLRGRTRDVFAPEDGDESRVFEERFCRRGLRGVLRLKSAIHLEAIRGETARG
jgi:hypothetical protein